MGSSRSDHIYNKQYQSMLDGLDDEGYNNVKEKKCRLSVDQVKGLERNFEVENKLEPERKVRLAKELGLQPRQVAIWFQNRRARWKTKQLERDYSVLKASFDSLHKNYESLKLDEHALLTEIKELKLKLNKEKNMPIKEEETTTEAIRSNLVTSVSEDVKLKMNKTKSTMTFVCSEYSKSDGSSDSDSIAILNDEQSLNASTTTTSSSFVLNSSPLSSPLSSNCFTFTLSNTNSDSLTSLQDNVYQPQLVKMEEHGLFSGDEACNFFAEEQAPSLHWYCAEQWA